MLLGGVCLTVSCLILFGSFVLFQPQDALASAMESPVQQRQQILLHCVGRGCGPRSRFRTGKVCCKVGGARKKYGLKM